MINIKLNLNVIIGVIIILAIIIIYYSYFHIDSMIDNKIKNFYIKVEKNKIKKDNAMKNDMLKNDLEQKEILEDIENYKNEYELENNNNEEENDIDSFVDPLKVNGNNSIIEYKREEKDNNKILVDRIFNM
jgi:hypothetical protein